ncbi:hypothetical protein ACFVFQ_38210 [Streptomyces sp. NPDC057743]|uniref:hypothetical protein n=1 Tax=Streptomyces sp. NPDC057743 TaxID=3346236 RepID=UPI0036B47DD5
MPPQLPSTDTEHPCLVCTAPLPSDATYRHVCDLCLFRLRRTLTDLPHLYVQLHLALPHGTPHRRLEWAATAVPWASRDHPPPLRLALLAHADHCVTTMRNWATDALPYVLPTGPTRPGPLLQNLCRNIAAHLPACLTTPTDGHHAGTLWTAYTHTRHLLGLDDPPTRLPTPCPSCHLRSLSATYDGTITCRTCHTTWPAHTPHIAPPT